MKLNQLETCRREEISIKYIGEHIWLSKSSGPPPVNRAGAVCQALGHPKDGEEAEETHNEIQVKGQKNKLTRSQK